jgi:hypothetical protein
MSLANIARGVVIGIVLFWLSGWVLVNVMLL